jgi:hypothetical protein
VIAPSRFFFPLAALLAGANCVAAAEIPGARVPFTTLEAESPEHATTGERHFLRDPGAWPSTPEREASGGGFVELRNDGQFVEVSVTRKANGLVLRHCIPDAPNGGGQSATLGLYVNGQRVESLELSSKHNWLYGQGTVGENGQRNEPTGFPHVFWDESAHVLRQALQPGDRLRLQKDARDSAEFYRIDLLDLEDVPEPLPRPENSLSVADYGAPSGDADRDTAAILKCIADSKSQGKSVWLPAGEYRQNAVFTLDGIKVAGAGMWHTRIVDAVGDGGERTWAGNIGFKFSGEGPRVADLRIEGSVTTRRSKGAKPFHGTSRYWELENVWITHTNTGIWMAGEKGKISGCRVRFTYADGININNGNTAETRQVLVENNHVRGSGDDGMAILCHDQENGTGETSNITLRNNTIAAIWWGSGTSLAGGTGHTIENNHLADGGGFVINLPPAWKKRPLKESIVRGNLIERCGAGYGKRARGAIWIFPAYTTATEVLIEDNRIASPWFGGVDVQGTLKQEITFRGNQISNPPHFGFRISEKVVGQGTFESNAVTGLEESRNAFLNLASSKYAVLGKGNSW